jgi:hypothetical protein
MSGIVIVILMYRHKLIDSVQSWQTDRDMSLVWNWKFINVLTLAHNWASPSVRWIQIHAIVPFTTPCRKRTVYFMQRFQLNLCIHFHSSHGWYSYMPHPSHPPSFHYPLDLPLGSNYILFSGHCPQILSICAFSSEGENFTSYIQHSRQNYNIIYLNMAVDTKEENKVCLIWIAENFPRV